MDRVIFESVCVMTVVFLISHAIAFRHIVHDNAVPWLLWSYGIGYIGIVLVMFFVPTIALLSFAELVVSLCVVSVIYTLVVGIYIICIFSVIESSVTIKLLSVIGGYETHGVSTRTLMTQINAGMIVNRRLQRLVYLGTVKKDGELYSLTNTKSSFIVREYIFRIVQLLFPPM